MERTYSRNHVSTSCFCSVCSEPVGLTGSQMSALTSTTRKPLHLLMDNLVQHLDLFVDPSALICHDCHHVLEYMDKIKYHYRILKDVVVKSFQDGSHRRPRDVLTKLLENRVSTEPSSSSIEDVNPAEELQGPSEEQDQSDLVDVPPLGSLPMEILDIRDIHSTDSSLPSDVPPLGLLEPVPQEPALQEPALQEPALQEPALQEPALQEPALQEPALQEPALQEPALQEPLAEDDVQHRLQEPQALQADIVLSNWSPVLRRNKLHFKGLRPDSNRITTTAAAVKSIRKGTKDVLWLEDGTSLKLSGNMDVANSNLPDNIKATFSRGMPRCWRRVVEEWAAPTVNIFDESLVRAAGLRRTSRGRVSFPPGREDWHGETPEDYMRRRAASERKRPRGSDDQDEGATPFLMRYTRSLRDEEILECLFADIPSDTDSEIDSSSDSDDLHFERF